MTDSTGIGSLLVETHPNEVQSVSNSIIMKAFIPVNATELEHRLHGYLDTVHAFAVDIKSKIEEDVKDCGKSPLIIDALNKRNLARKTGPSLAERRKKNLGAFNGDLKELQLNQKGCNTALPM